MTTDPTNLIAQADAALEDVTPGPWQTGEMVPTMVHNWWLAPNDPNASPAECSNEANANFIAASRQLVPALRDALIAQDAVVAALEAEVARLREDAEARDMAHARHGYRLGQADASYGFRRDDPRVILSVVRAALAQQGEAG
jgi:hypothetical protein